MRVVVLLFMALNLANGFLVRGPFPMQRKLNIAASSSAKSHQRRLNIAAYGSRYGASSAKGLSMAGSQKEGRNLYKEMPDGTVLSYDMMLTKVRMYIYVCVHVCMCVSIFISSSRGTVYVMVRYDVG